MGRQRSRAGHNRGRGDLSVSARDQVHRRNAIDERAALFTDALLEVRLRDGVLYVPGCEAIIKENAGEDVSVAAILHSLSHHDGTVIFSTGTSDLQAPPHAVISERHRQLLVQARDEAQKARGLLEQGMEENTVLAAEHLRDALEFLGQVTGRTYHEELLDNIFSRFCIGK